MTRFAKPLALLLAAALTLLPALAAATPPPWAPAHGWRAKQGQTYARPLPFDLDLGRCNRDLIGAALGAAGGGVLGSELAGREDRPVAIVVGAVLGGLLGGYVGHELDRLDRACFGSALEYLPEGRSAGWAGPGGAWTRVTPRETFRDGGRDCRRFTTQIAIDGRRETATGIACRRADGTWQRI
jgi:surface antigen